MNISPQVYNGDDWEFSRFSQSTIGPVGGDSAAGDNGAAKGAFSWISKNLISFFILIFLTQKCTTSFPKEVTSKFSQIP